MGVIATATCGCGALRAEVSEAPLRISACHCDDCRRLSGSAFTLNARFEDGAVTVTGASRTFARRGDEGSTIYNGFCPSCGVTVFYRNSDVPGMVAVRVGCFVPPDLPAPDVTVYDDRRPDWLRFDVEGIERWS